MIERLAYLSGKSWLPPFGSGWMLVCWLFAGHVGWLSPAPVLASCGDYLWHGSQGALGSALDAHEYDYVRGPIGFPLAVANDTPSPSQRCAGWRCSGDQGLPTWPAPTTQPSPKLGAAFTQGVSISAPPATTEVVEADTLCIVQAWRQRIFRPPRS